ncbi:MAG: hypothetical protein WB507_04830 [Solirubrobacterales bacterium]
MNLRPHIHRPASTTAPQENTHVNQENPLPFHLKLRTPRCAVLGATLFALLVPLANASSAQAAGPAWKLTVTPNADYVLSGSEYPGVYKVEAENVGGEPMSTAEKIILKNTLPPGLSADAVRFFDSELGYGELNAVGACPTAVGRTVECDYPEGEGFVVAFLEAHPLQPHQRFVMIVHVPVPSAFEGPIEDLAQISGGDAPAAHASATNTANPEPPFGLLRFASSLTDSAGQPYTQAGGHPYQFTTEFNFETYSCANPEASSGAWTTGGTCPMHDPKDITAELPPGLIANPEGVPHCSLADYFAEECERNKVSVGFAGIRDYGNTEGAFHEITPIYNLQPQGPYPGELGITIGGLPIILITTGIRGGSDYGVTATNVAVEAGLSRVRLTLWGVPAAEEHNRMRGKDCAVVTEEEFRSAEQLEKWCESESRQLGNGGPAGVKETPFITMPTECSGTPLTVTGRYDSWDVPGEYAEDPVAIAAVDGCNQLKFEPEIEVRPTTDLADSPSGLQFNLHVPQNEEVDGLATPELKEAVVKLPAGLSVNPASAEGLGGCSEAQVALHVEEAAHCPEASKLGSVEAHTRLLTEPLQGSLYLATPHQNPTGALLAGYIVLEGQGIRIKLPGSFETDPKTGQITTRFLENPQLPFEELKLEIYGGARGALRTPATCGSYETTSELTPFSAPESGPPAEPSATFETVAGPQGGACPRHASQEPNEPRFHAGTETPRAGIFSPFALKLVREDGSQEMKSVETTLPPGLVGKLAGIAECPQADLEAAQRKSGAEEKASPSCPAGSELGTVAVGAGAGPTPIYVSGHAYLAGPYDGAPLSLAIVTPAVAGPFDLGTVVVRTALYVNPETAQITAKSDPIPTVLQGIPLDVRSIALKMNRPDFTLNPTNCDELGFTGSALSVLGVSAPLSQRFQVGGCPALPFAPKLAISLKGGTKRAQNPALKAVLTASPGEANVAAAQVTLPHAELLDNAHIGTVCTKPVFAEGAALGEKCPPASIYGFAKAETSLLEKPLEGPVYLRSPLPGHRLPDLVAALNGEIDVALVGKVDTGKGGGIRNTFELVPDAPVSRFTLEMQGGKKSLLENSANLCSSKTKTKALVDLTGQNGKLDDTEALIKTSCKHEGKKHRKRRRAQRSHR